MSVIDIWESCYEKLLKGSWFQDPFVYKALMDLEERVRALEQIDSQLIAETTKLSSSHDSLKDSLGNSSPSK